MRFAGSSETSSKFTHSQQDPMKSAELDRGGSLIGCTGAKIFLAIARMCVISSATSYFMRSTDPLKRAELDRGCVSDWMHQCKNPSGLY